MPSCATETGITLVNYYTSYSGASCLNSTWTPTQTLTSSDIDAWIVTLISREQAAAPGSNVDAQGNYLSQTNENSAKDFATKSATLRVKIQNEYCYYYNRYMYALNALLTQATVSGADLSTANTTYTTLKTNTENLNGKLNQIIQVLQSLSNNRLATLNTYYGTNTGVNKINNELNTIRNNLERDAKALNDSQMQTSVKTAMINYSIEKNNSSRNLLAIYGFLNIVAIGTLFYLYRNMKS